MCEWRHGKYSCCFDGRFRYVLRESCSVATAIPGKRIAWICLNPSPQDNEHHLGHTLRRIKSFSRENGFASFVVVNLFGRIAQTPKELGMLKDIVGLKNDYWIRKELKKADMIVCAWGEAMGLDRFRFHKRVAEIKKMLRNRKLYCLDMTEKGNPTHPSRAKKEIKPDIWANGLCEK